MEPVWERYWHQFLNFELVLNQTKLWFAIEKELAKDFPKHIPQALLTKLDLTFDILSNAIEVYRKSPLSPEGKTFRKEGIKLPTGPNIFMEYISCKGAALKLDDIDKSTNFEMLIFQRNIITAFAHVDAFLSDSVRAACEARPEIMKSSKKIEWETVLSCGQWNTLMHFLIEEYANKFSWRTLTERVAYLREQLGLDMGIPEWALSYLDEAENVRHIMVHNGGNVSQTYLERTGRTDLAIGQPYPITTSYLGRRIELIHHLGAAAYRAVAAKFFNKTDEECPKTKEFGELPEQDPSLKKV